MKASFIRLIRFFSVTLLLVVFGATIFIVFTGPKLPDDTDRVIDEVISSKLPNFIKGQSGHIISDNYRIWYESIAAKGPQKGVVLLFMGMGTDAFGWPQTFIDALTDSGYQVIRYDYRGTGESDWIPDWKENPYTITDLAKDARVIVDKLKSGKVHLIGLSLGGMVAQKFAIANPDKTLSLTSIMSSGNIKDNELPKAPISLIINFIKIGIKYGLYSNHKNTIKMMLAAKILLRGDAQYDIDVKKTAEQVLYNLKKRNGYNRDASNQHEYIVKLSTFNYDQLKDFKFPVLIIHGVNDPLVSIEHSIKLAGIIPDARTKWMENMGHDLPEDLIEVIHKEIVFNINLAKQ